MRASRRLERLALARGQPVLVLERAHVAIDLRQVLGQLRFALAAGSGAPPQRSTGSGRGAPRFRAPGCVPAIRRRADRSARTCRDRSRTPRSRRPRSSTRRSSARRSGSSRSPSRRAAGSDRRSATPSAPPSIGSVPEPTSSSRTRPARQAAVHRGDVGDVRRRTCSGSLRSTARRRCPRTPIGTPAAASHRRPESAAPPAPSARAAPPS